MAATATLITELSDRQCDILMKELEKIDKQIKKRVDYVIQKHKMTKPQSLEYIVTANPILWAKVYLDWEARDYQEPIILEGKRSKKLVLRLGRRLGKTDSLCILTLWFSYTQINKGPNNQYDILFLAPYETQVDLFFKRLHQLIDMSPLLQGLITRDVHHHIELTINGVISSILGLTAGANNATTGANSSRGQRADVIVLDETDYIGSNQLTNVLNIRNEAPERIRVISASTPSGKHEEYYKWCQYATKTYSVSDEDKKNNIFSGYQISERPLGEGNGWTQIYAPSNVNKELLKFNPDTGQTYLEDIRDELSELRYQQEVLAEFGEEALGVYQKKYIQMAIDEGLRLKWSYITKWDPNSRKAYLKSTHGQNIRCLGVDWDKYANATNMVCMEFDRFHQDENGTIIPVFKVLFREEIARSEFTYTNAMNKIIALNEEYKFDWIAIDRGYGETQLELLHKYGLQNPESQLADKVVGYQFSEKLEVTDPYTRKKDKKHLKPFMVNNSVNLFEKCKVVLDPKDKYMIEELEEYTVKSISSDGRPIYSDENEHAIDAMNLALLVFAQKYDSLLRKVFSIKTAAIGKIDKRQTDVKDRSFINEDNAIIGILNGHSEQAINLLRDPKAKAELQNASSYIGVINIMKTKTSGRSQMYRRKKF
jgi:replicative DNA helicase